MKKKIYLHFSVDDVFKSLIEISDKNIKLKKHWFFSKFYKLWKKYKITTSLYIFYEGKINGRLRSLTEVRNIAEELRENWIFFGPHALNFSSPPHKFPAKSQKKHIAKIYKEIQRFTGKKYFTKQVRLHEYSESYELKNFFNYYKVTSLFSTDKIVGAHRLPVRNKNQLLKTGKTIYKKLRFVRTDLRIEMMVNNSKSKNENMISEILNRRNFITIYTHEIELKKNKCSKNLIDTIGFLSKNYYLLSMKP